MHAHTVMSAPIILNAPSEHASPVHPRKQTQMFGAPHTPFTQSWSHKAAIHAHIHIRESYIAGAFYQTSMQTIHMGTAEINILFKCIVTCFTGASGPSVKTGALQGASA